MAYEQLIKELNPLDFKASSKILGGYSSGHGGGYWGWVNGEYVYTYDGGTMGEVVINTGSNGQGYSAHQAISAMLTSMGAGSWSRNWFSRLGDIRTLSRRTRIFRIVFWLVSLGDIFI